MLHGGEFEELEMLEGPHKGQTKLIPTKAQSDKNVEQNRREHAEMQEGFSRLNQNQQSGLATSEVPSPQTIDDYKALPPHSIYKHGNRFLVKMEPFHSTLGDTIHFSFEEAAKEAESEKANADRKSQLAKEAAEIESAEKQKKQLEIDSYKGFLKDKPMAFGKAKSALDKLIRHSGTVKTKRQWMEDLHKDGWTIGDGNELRDPKDNTVSYDVTPTEMSYFKHLQSQNSTPSPGITLDTRSNESAKANDQMGLFGDVANVPRGPATLPPGGESKGKQLSMFDTQGDPDQMLMFDDGVTPEDRVMKFGRSGSIRNRADELVRYWGLSTASLPGRVNVERYGSDHWKGQPRQPKGKTDKGQKIGGRFAPQTTESFEEIADQRIKIVNGLENAPKSKKEATDWWKKNGSSFVIGPNGLKVSTPMGLITKITSGNKDFPRVRMALVPSIQDLIANGVGFSRSDYRNEPDMDFVSEVYSAFQYDTQVYRVRWIVKHFKEDSQKGTKLHSARVEDIVIEPQNEKSSGTRTRDAEAAPHAHSPSTLTIRQLFNGVNPFISDKDKEKYSAPTKAQREAGNYPKKHIRLHGLDISIETAKGERRRPEWPPMPCDYGYIRGTVGKDKDHVDVFIGPNKQSELVVVVDQVDQSGKFDEHKVMLGFSNEDSAISQYKKAYTSGWKVGPVTVMTIGQFKSWLKDGSQNKPLERQVSKFSSRSIMVPA